MKISILLVALFLYAGCSTIENEIVDTNSAPVAVDDVINIPMNSLLTTTNVIANDTDADQDILSLSDDFEYSGEGLLARNSDGVSIDYTPALDFVGDETIRYTVSDGKLEAKGSLQITVRGLNQSPVAVDDTAKIPKNACSTRINVTANDTDADNDALNITEVSTSGTGTVSLNNDGVSVDYTPASGFTGEETITYSVSDGSLSDATGTLTITVAEADYERTISFSKAAGADPKQAANQDRITDLIWITRGDESLIYNAVLETAANKANSPKGTLWAEGNIEDRCSLTFDTLDNTVPRKKLIVGKNLVMFLIEEQKYISIKFTSWGAKKNVGGGEFTYMRSAVFE